MQSSIETPPCVSVYSNGATEADAIPKELSIEDRISTIKDGLKVVGDDIEKGLTQEVLASLAALKDAGNVRFMSLRSEFKKQNKDIRLSDLDDLIKRASSNDEDQVEADEKGGVVETLVEMVSDMGELFVDKTSNPYVSIGTQTFSLDGRQIKEFIAQQHYRNTGRVPKSQQLSDALTTLAGCAREGGELREVYIRVANDAKRKKYFLDMANTDGQIICLSAEKGVEVIDNPGLSFLRPRGMLPLMRPDNTGELEDLKKLVNIEEGDYPLLVSALCEIIRCDTAYPVIELGGEQGSGKSVTQNNIRLLLDPKDVNLRSAPRKPEDIFISAINNHIVSYNNLSHLSADMQDILCSLSTGGGLSVRKLYTDSDEASYDTTRPIILNGIVALATKPDLISRLVRLECPPIESRLSDTEIKGLMETHGPKALGYILSTFCEALMLLPGIQIGDSPRLMDFALFGEAVSRSMGNDPDMFLTRYKESLGYAAKRAVEGAPVIDELMKYVDKEGEVNTTVGRLFDQLSIKTFNKAAWPKTARGFRESLNRFQPTLRMMGYHIEFPNERRDGQRINISFTPPQ